MDEILQGDKRWRDHVDRVRVGIIVKSRTKNHKIENPQKLFIFVFFSFRRDNSPFSPSPYVSVDNVNPFHLNYFSSAFFVWLNRNIVLFFAILLTQPKKNTLKIASNIRTSLAVDTILLLHTYIVYEIKHFRCTR